MIDNVLKPNRHDQSMDLYHFGQLVVNFAKICQPRQIGDISRYHVPLLVN